MVEADHGKAALARLPARGDVGLRLDEDPVWIVRPVRRGHRFRDHRIVPEQEATAFGRLRVPRVADDQVERAAGDSNRYKASTAMAMPIPPPMQSDAIPKRSFLARSAWTSVVRTRAPLAPIGCPSAIAPPCTFTFSGSSPSSRTTASEW